MADAKAGQRFQCGTCGTQVVVIKTEGAVPRCCGTEMESLAAKPKSASALPSPPARATRSGALWPAPGRGPLVPGHCGQRAALSVVTRHVPQP